MAITAELRVMYRRTTNQHPGSWYERVEHSRAKRWVDAQIYSDRATSDNLHAANRCRFEGWLLFVWHLRGTDPGTCKTYEHQYYKAIPPDTRLRAIKAKPGFTHTIS